MTDGESVAADEPATKPAHEMATGADGETAIGEPPSEEDKQWKEFLTPEKIVGRNEERAKFVVSTVTVVGALITGLGLVLGARVTSTQTGTTLAAFSVGLAALAVALSVTCLVVASAQAISSIDMFEAEQFYKSQARRGTVVGVAGLLLVVSVLLAAIAAGMAMTGIVSGQPNLTASITNDKKSWDISAVGRLDGLKPKDNISITLTGIRKDRSRLELAQQVSRAGSLGNVSVSLAVQGIKGFANYRFDLRAPNVICSASLSPSSSIKNARVFMCSKP
jgi:hypothetical protein